MTTRMGNGHYPLVPASEYLDLLERYRDIPNIARMPQTTQGAKAEEQKQSFWKTLISVKTLINVWMPTVMTVGGTIIGAVIGAKYSAPQEQPRQKPKQAIEKHYGHQNIGTNQTTYVYAYPKEHSMILTPNRLTRTFQESILEIRHNEALIILRTLPGTAQSVAFAVDYMKWPEILGTIAGDDTVFLAIDKKENMIPIINRINSYK